MGRTITAPARWAVVELAKAFAANGTRPKRSILFVVFASEERGLLGSYWMAAHPLRPLATTRAMINFDMIGRDEKPSPQTEGLITIPADTSNRLNLIGALYSPEYDQVVHEEDKRVGLVLDDRFDHESALNVFFRSDQFPFVSAGHSGVLVVYGFSSGLSPYLAIRWRRSTFPRCRRFWSWRICLRGGLRTMLKRPVFISNPMPAGVGKTGR